MQVAVGQGILGCDSIDQFEVDIEADHGEPARVVLRIGARDGGNGLAGQEADTASDWPTRENRARCNSHRSLHRPGPEGPNWRRCEPLCRRPRRERARAREPFIIRTRPAGPGGPRRQQPGRY